jgi:hypothetical protein
MSKQILFGYKDGDGQTAPVILAGPTEPAKLAKILLEASRDHIFPEGILLLERVNCEVVGTEKFISAGVTEHLKNRRDEEANLLKTRTEKSAALTAQQKAIGETRAALNKAVIARNTVLGDKLKAEVKLRNLLATPETLQSKNHKSLVESASTELEAVKGKVEKAVADYQAAFEAHEAAKNPKPEPEKPPVLETK